YDGVSFKGSLEKTLAQAACYRLFHNEGDVGCRTSSSSGTTGALYEIGSLDDIAAARQLDLDLGYVLPASMLQRDVLAQLHRAQGVIVVEDDSIWAGVAGGMYSPDLQSPQGQGSPQESLTLEPETRWNLHGNGLLYEEFNFPIVRADPMEVDSLKSYCFDNRRYGYRSSRVNFVDFNFYMGKSGLTSKDCLEWRDIHGDRSPQCIPLGGNSIWGTTAHLDSRKKVLATVGIDSTAMFHQLAFGANDAAAPIAAFLGAIEAIGRYDHKNLEHQILFFAANAEEWGYAGSRRFVQDIKSFACKNEVGVEKSHVSGMPMCADPVYPSTLFDKILRGDNTSITEDEVFVGGLSLDQIGSIYQVNDDGDTELYVHSNDPDSSTMRHVVEASASVSGVEIVSVEKSSMPPTPLTSFVNEFEVLGEESAVITGYQSVFKDPRYHSHYDNATFVSEISVIRATELFAKSLVSMAGGDATAVEINTTWVSSALKCLLSDWNCAFFADSVSSEKVIYQHLFYDSGNPLFPPSYYADVLSPYSRQPIVNHNGRLYGKYSEKWNEKDDIMYSTPNILEAIIRTTITTLDTTVPEGEQRLYCSVSSDCDEYFCEFFSFEIPMVKLECLMGVCVCPVASYHVALDPGNSVVVTPGHYTIVDSSAPIFTEPNWSNDVGV
ncbi:unnamed protein product, partial [Ectocarpus fasciculatus]